MAIKTYLYSGSPVTTGELDPLLAVGAGPVVGSSLARSLVPITIDNSHKADLDEAMAALSYVYVGEYTGAPALTGRQDWGSLANDPSGIVGPNDGDTYYNTQLKMNMAYDSSRSKWLSVESQTFLFGRDGATVAGQYYRGIDGRILSNTIGWRMPWYGTVTALSYTRSNNAACVFEVVADGVTIGTLASVAVEGDTTALNADVDPGEILSARNQLAGGLTRDVSAWMKVRWRSP